MILIALVNQILSEKAVHALEFVKWEFSFCKHKHLLLQMEHPEVCVRFLVLVLSFIPMLL